MRKIIKGQEPGELATWKRDNPKKRYEDLPAAVRQAIRCVAIKEQFGLCGYCCKLINETNSNNEHVISQQNDKTQTLNFANIIASCNKRNRCNQARGAKELALTPLMPECETELKFSLSGRVDGQTERAKEAIMALGLDNKAIREERKRQVDELLYTEGTKPNELDLLGDELLIELINILDKPDDSGILLPYSPALINIIKGILTKA